MNNPTFLIDGFISEREARLKEELADKNNRYLGWVSTYIPEEIILAFGFIPYRITGFDIPLSKSKTYLSGNVNPFVQSCLESALKGSAGFLEGVIISTDTDAMKRLYDAWINFVNTPFVYMFDVPRIITDDGKFRYRKSIEHCIYALSKFFKRNIGSGDIINAITTCNKTRVLLNELNNLRKETNPVITSGQFLNIVKLCFHCERTDFNESLEDLVYGLKKTRETEEKEERVRILITGSYNDQGWFLQAIEDAGAMSVCEDLCTRLRYFKEEAALNKDPIDSIVDRYLNKPPSARMLAFEKRMDYLLDLVKEFKADGVIYHILKFDDPYLFEYPDVKRLFDQNKIPLLRLETDYTKSGYNQVKTRIQAFVEIIKTQPVAVTP